MTIHTSLDTLVGTSILKSVYTSIAVQTQKDEPHDVGANFLYERPYSKVLTGVIHLELHAGLTLVLTCNTSEYRHTHEKAQGYKTGLQNSREPGVSPLSILYSTLHLPNHNTS